jgi:phosphoenolpyruvate carboxykinase (GTP)
MRSIGAGNKWTPLRKRKAAHPKQPFRRSDAKQSRCSTLKWKTRAGPNQRDHFRRTPERHDAAGFSGDDGKHGVYIGRHDGFRDHAAATGAVGRWRRDPMAMLPFCGYNIGDYSRALAREPARAWRIPAHLSRQWFRKRRAGKFLWPWFWGQHAGAEMDYRALRRRARREQSRDAMCRPRPEDLDLEELDVAPENGRGSCGQTRGMGKELAGQEEFFKSLVPNVPEELLAEQKKVAQRLRR